MSILDRVLIYDTETTCYKWKEERHPDKRNGSAFCKANSLVMSGFRWVSKDFNWTTWADMQEATQNFFNESTLIVGFNLKFDLHWARRIGVDISNINIWDCQLGEFLLSNQHTKYPSLNGACEKYGLPKKLDVIEEEYWQKCIDTDEIPRDILQTYLEQDLLATESVFKKQIRQFKGLSL